MTAAHTIEQIFADRLNAMRLLVISSAVSGVNKLPGEEWSDLVASSYRGHLYTATRKDLVDYDVFIVDADKMSERQDSTDRAIGPQIVERVSGGGCLICFASVNPYPWLPVQFTPKSITGERIRIEDSQPDVLKALLEKYQAGMTYKTQFEGPKGWTPLATALNSYPVAGYASLGSGAIVMLPEFKNRAPVIRSIIDSVLPALLPGLAREAPVLSHEEAPDWLPEFPVKAAEKISQQINTLEDKIHRMHQRLDDNERKRHDLVAYQGLLWLDGKPLEAVVERAVNLLRIPAHPKGQVDLACPIRNNGELYIEVEGTKGPVQIRKGRQLLGYIAEADDPAETLGAIIGNPFRKEHPSNRKAEWFSPQLESLANNQGWSLVTTTQLFGWVIRHLDGENVIDEVHRALGLK